MLSWAKFTLIALLFLIALLVAITYRLKQATKSKYPNTKIISFLHPFCNDCGGGEKVLWMIVNALANYKGYQTNYKLKINIICAIKDSKESIAKKALDRFNIDITNKIENVVAIDLIRLKSGDLLKPKPFLTMVVQMLGQVLFALETITTVYSDIYIDITGLPFSYAVLRILGLSKVSAYVHYPYISNDMILDIKNNVQGVHSRGILSKLPFFKYLKLVYYGAILYLYKFNGKFIDFAFCNSSWTYNHMKSLWTKTKLSILYPPCSIEKNNDSKRFMDREHAIVSFAQIRPEKNHKLQVDIIKKVIQRTSLFNLKLKILGSVRGPEDEKLLQEIKDYIEEQNLSNSIEFHINEPYSKIKYLLSTARVAIHTMKDEHFGISVIEMMAAGLITIAHDSAGPRNDIIGPAPSTVGLLAHGKNNNKCF